MWGSVPLITVSTDVMIILGSQVPVDPMEYVYTILECALGHHDKAFQWLHLVCTIPTKVSLEVSV
jgi:hypothetical protein